MRLLILKSGLMLILILIPILFRVLVQNLIISLVVAVTDREAATVILVAPQKVVVGVIVGVLVYVARQEWA